MRVALSIWIPILGVFQLKRAPPYAAEKVGNTSLTGAVAYTIQRCRLFPNVIRAPTQSAHSQRRSYYPTIQFSPDEIRGWWCDCPIGSRIVGCCSHVSSVIWFLCYQRSKSNDARRTTADPMNFARDSMVISDFDDSSNDDDATSYRYSLAWACFSVVFLTFQSNKYDLCSDSFYKPE